MTTKVMLAKCREQIRARIQVASLPNEGFPVVTLEQFVLLGQLDRIKARLIPLDNLNDAKVEDIGAHRAAKDDLTAIHLALCGNPEVK